MNKNTQIAILRLSALGDCINAFGIVGLLAKADINVHFITDKKFCSVFQDAKGIPLCNLHGISLKNGKIKELLKLHKELKEFKFDALLNMQTSIKASLVSLCIKAHDKYGYDKQRSREGQCFFVNKKIHASPDPHVISGFLEFAKAIGIENPKPYWDFKITKEEQTIALKHFKKDKIFLLSPASAKAYKNWNIDGYVQTVNYMHTLGFEIGLIGDNSKICLDLCSNIEKKINFKVENLAGKTNLRELLVLISCAKLMVSPDSGPMHMASALNIPVVGLFAIHNEKRVGPYNFMDLNVSVYEKHASAELKNSNIPWRYRVKNEHAMNDISFEMVKKAIDRAISTYKIN